MHKNNKSKTNIIKTLMAMAIILIIAFTAADAMAERWSDNLLTNPGAETGDMSGWDNHFGSVYHLGGGNYTFWGKYCNGWMAQDVDLSPYEDSIKTGTVEIEAGGWYHGLKNATTNYSLSFYDVYGKGIGHDVSGDLTAAAWREHKKTSEVPKGTGKVRSRINYNLPGWPGLKGPFPPLFGRASFMGTCEVVFKS